MALAHILDEEPNLVHLMAPDDELVADEHQLDDDDDEEAAYRHDEGSADAIALAEGLNSCLIICYSFMIFISLYCS